MSDPKKKNKETKATSAVARDKSVEEIADAIVEGLESFHNSDLESFDNYAQKVRSNIYQNLAKFRSRFAKGYQVLIDELSKKK